MYHIPKQWPLPKIGRKLNKLVLLFCNIISYIKCLHVTNYIGVGQVNPEQQFRLKHTILKTDRLETVFHQFLITFQKLLVIHTIEYQVFQILVELHRNEYFFLIWNFNPRIVFEFRTFLEEKIKQTRNPGCLILFCKILPIDLGFKNFSVCFRIILIFRKNIHTW